MQRVGVIGSGVVGQVLAAGFLKHGYEVMVGTREAQKLAGWVAGAGAGAKVGSVAERAAVGEIGGRAVHGAAAEEAGQRAGPATLAGKVVIDATNPIAQRPPQNGVLGFFTSLEDSLMERLQRAAPAARFVKAWNSVGNALMVDPQLAGGPPTMFICGNDAAAKAEVEAILDRFGWESEDLGAVEAARAIEPLCILWCIPGFLRNDWFHAYKVVRARERGEE